MNKVRLHSHLINFIALAFVCQMSISTTRNANTTGINSHSIKDIQIAQNPLSDDFVCYVCVQKQLLLCISELF